MLVLLARDSAAFSQLAKAALDTPPVDYLLLSRGATV